MPDGSQLPSSMLTTETQTSAPPDRSKANRRCRCASVHNASPLVGNPSGMLYRLQQVDALLTAMDRAEPAGRHSYAGRELQREAEALVDLAVTQEPTNMSDCVALMAAVYEKVGDVYREERSAQKMAQLLEAPLNALERVTRFIAAEIGLRAEDFGGDWIFVGERA